MIPPAIPFDLKTTEKAPMATNLSKNADEFLSTLTLEVFEAEDFFDWPRIDGLLREMESGLQKLEGFRKSPREARLASLLHADPGLLKPIHLLTAHQPKRLQIGDGRYIDFEKDALAMTPARANEIEAVLTEIGVVSAITASTSLRDVVRGILIGLEPNSRKSRRGQIMEKSLGNFLSGTVIEVSKKLHRELKLVPSTHIETKAETKTVDFAIIENGKPKIAIETNFYSTSGSKPSETLTRAYPDLQLSLKQLGIPLIVITDGAGWLKMKNVIETALEKLDYCLNFQQSKKHLGPLLTELLK